MKNKDNFEEVIDEYPDYTSTAMMEEYVNYNPDDMNQYYLNNEIKIGLDK